MAGKEQAWELVQIKGLTAWANTYLDDASQIKNLETDLIDGVKMCLLTEGLKNRIDELARKKIGPWTRKPAHRMQRIENANIAINFLKNEIKVKLMTGAEDIVGDQELNRSNLKMVLGLLWSTFRKTLGLEEHSNVSEEYAALLEWVRSVTAGYKGVEIRGMKDSWADGLAFSALLHKAGATEIQFDKLDKGQGANNLTNAFRVAESRFKIPQLLEIPDLVASNPDERSVAFYLNLMRHAMHEAFEKSKTSGTLQELQMRLAAEEAARRQAEEELMRARHQNEELETRLKLETLLHADEGALLEEKICALTELLEDPDLDAQARERLRQKLEEAQRARQELEELKRKLQDSNTNLLAELEAAERRRQQLQQEIEELRKRVQKAMEKAKRRGKAAVELEGELEQMRKQAFVQQRARYGLEVLKRNLEEHLEDMYKWRELNSKDDEVLKQVFDLQTYLASMKGKSFEQQLEGLNQSLQGENGTLKRLLKLKEDVLDLNDTFIRSGWLDVKDSGKIKEWKKLFFNLRGPKLTYHKADNTDRSIGGAVLDNADIHSPADFEDKQNVVRIELRDPKGFVIALAASSKDEAEAWYASLLGERLYARYLAALDKSKRRPDMRVVHLFRSTKLNSIFVDNVPVSADELVAIAHSLKFHLGVDTISVTNAALDDTLAKELAVQLGRARFRHLKLGENKIGADGAAAIADALSKSKYIKTVELQGNNITGAAVQALAALPLTELNLDNNKLGDAGASAYANGASGDASQVAHVHLSGNNIGDAGASALAALLQKNKNISKLFLNNNNISDAGASALAGALSASALSEVYLANNKIGNAGAAALQKAAAGAKHVKLIDLGGNPLVGGSNLGEGFKVSALTLTQ